MLGGEKSREATKANSRAIPEKAQRTGKPSYLEPISQSMHVPIEGLSEKIETRVAIGEKHSQNHVENLRPLLFGTY